EQFGFDPVSGEARFAIHFKPKGRKKIKDVFRYDWRIWTLPEIRDLLAEAGFRKTHVYWEGNDGKAKMEPVWIAFIAAEK
ncbi:MAG: class I SAM-dependent methyltransferase, partial [Elusimicrobiota bacterium]